MVRSQKETPANQRTNQNSRDFLWRVALYIRLSKEDGHGESESVANQRAILGRYMEAEFQGRYEIVGHYIDDGRSGTDDAREAFQQMKQGIEDGRINCIVCKTLARAFRNYADQGYYLEHFFPRYQVRFISIGDPSIDTFMNPDALTGLEVPIAGLMNDRYASRASNDIRRTFHMKRERGDFIGAFPPYGFLKDPKNKNRLQPDPAIVPIKQAMKDWVLTEGMSLAGVARNLNSLGIPNPTAYKKKLGWNYKNPKSAKNDGLWTSGTVRSVLLSPANIGHMVQGRQRVVSYKIHRKSPVPEASWYVAENVITPTFPLDDYEALKKLLSRPTRSADGNGRVYPLAGFLRCRDCGKAMHRRTSRKYTYYACRTYTEKSKTACSRHAIPAILLEEAVWTAIRTQCSVFLLPELLHEIKAQKTTNATDKTLDALQGEAQQALKEIQTVSDGLYWDWKTKAITEEAYRRMQKKFEAQKAERLNALNELKKKTAHTTMTKEEGDIANAEGCYPPFLNLQSDSPLDRNLLAKLIDIVQVHEEKRITVYFGIEDALKRGMQDSGR